jgi:excisionase family DNA binding protein
MVRLDASFERFPPRSYSAGEVSGALGVPRRTVQRWVEEGTLKGYRTPGNHVRIWRTSVVEALRRAERPIPPLIANAPAHLLWVSVLEAPIPVDREPSLVNAALTLGAGEYELCVFAADLPREEAIELVRALRRNRSSAWIRVVGIDEDEAWRRELAAAGGDGAARDTTDALALCEQHLGTRTWVSVAALRAATGDSSSAQRPP